MKNKFICSTVLVALLFIVAICFWGCKVSDDSLTDVSVSGIDIIGYGLYEEVEIIDSRETLADENIVGDQFIEITQEHISFTEEILPDIGVMFGIEFIVRGEPENAEVELEIFHKHPEIIDEEGEAYHSQNYKVIKKIGDLNHALYMFEDDFELVAGEWAIEIYHDGEKKGEKKFLLK